MARLTCPPSHAEIEMAKNKATAEKTSFLKIMATLFCMPGGEIYPKAQDATAAVCIVAGARPSIDAGEVKFNMVKPLRPQAALLAVVQVEHSSPHSTREGCPSDQNAVGGAFWVVPSQSALRHNLGNRQLEVQVVFRSWYNMRQASARR